jgi:hypothetical protein
MLSCILYVITTCGIILIPVVTQFSARLRRHQHAENIMRDDEFLISSIFIIHGEHKKMHIKPFGMNM